MTKIDLRRGNWEDISRRWKADVVRKLPVIFQKDAERHYERTFKKDYVKANTDLRLLSESLTLKEFGLCVTSTREAVTGYAERLTERLQADLYSQARFDQKGAVLKLEQEVISRGFDSPINWNDSETIVPAVARMVDPAWWIRKIIKLQRRRIEEVARRIGIVGAYRYQAYVSDWAVAERSAQQDRNRRILEGLLAENQEGQQYTLQELADLSTSNPDNRFADLMVRMRGFENVAGIFGHAGLFLTLTTPSRFHPVLKKKGHPINPKWDGESVRDGQKWLCEIWAKIRAALDRRGIFVYGFRVAEPHHDGTPHWHMLLFCEPKYRRLIELLFDDYARGIRRPHFKRYKSGPNKGDQYTRRGTGTIDPSCAGNEPGAKKYRTECVMIDPKKGSATGYIAKYVAKNIHGKTSEGESIGYDHETGEDAMSSARRVDAWAATHGIRQFQQIGGPSVSIYRELRRLDGEELAETVASSEEAFMQQAEMIFEAADSGDWCEFVQQMGGPMMRRKDRPLELLKVEDGETKYGELKEILKGVKARLHAGVELITRFYEWTIRRIGNASDSQESPWSSVNNCTEPDEERRLIELDYQRGGGENYAVG